MTRLDSVAAFAIVLGLGSGASVALGGDVRVAAGLWLVLVLTFAFGWWVRGEEAKE